MASSCVQYVGVTRQKEPISVKGGKLSIGQHGVPSGFTAQQALFMEERPLQQFVIKY